MHHVDIPTLAQIKTLIEKRADACVSIYVPTVPLTQDIGAARIALKNLAAEAVRQLQEVKFDKRRLAGIEEQIEELAEDDEFWRVQANSLAIFATPDTMQTYRLPNKLAAEVEVSDRFHVKPLLRAVSFPFEAYVLVIAQDSARLIEVTRDSLAAEVKVAALPRDVSETSGRANPKARSPRRKLQGEEGYKSRLKQYCRAIDTALRPVLAGREIPLILATVESTAALYRSVNSYPHLSGALIGGNHEKMKPEEIAAAAREILSRENEARVEALMRQFKDRQAAGLASADLDEVARASVAGAVSTLLVDIDETIPGRVDEKTGAVTLVGKESAKTYDVVDEIAGHVILNGGTVVGVRKADLPKEKPLAAIFRFNPWRTAETPAAAPKTAPKAKSTSKSRA